MSRHYRMPHARPEGRISAGEASELLKVHHDTVRRYVAEGRLQDVERDRVGRYWLSETEVRALAERGWRDPDAVF